MNDIHVILNMGGIEIVTGTAADERAKQEMMQFVSEIAGALQTLDLACRIEGIEHQNTGDGVTEC